MHERILSQGDRARRAVRVRALIVALTLTLAAFEGAAGQDFPSRPVRFVVPYAAGGSGDLLARLLGNKLASIWGQQVVVDIGRAREA